MNGESPLPTEKIRVFFRSPRLKTEIEELERYGEVIDSKTVDFSPDTWDIQSGVDILYIQFEEILIDGDVTDAEWHIPMREVSAVRAIY